MMTGTSGRAALALGKQLESGHARHVDVGQDQYERGVPRIADALQRRRRRLGKFHDEPTGAEVAPKLLAKQHFDVGLIIDHKNKDGHARTPDFAKGLPRCGEEQS